MATVIPYGDPLAKKLFSTALFSQVQHEPGFMNLLSGPAPQEGQFDAKMKGQSSPDYPIVNVTDLSKGGGDTISVDLFNLLYGKPTMGDQKLAGRAMSLSSSTQDISINQYRAIADAGGKMTQQRTSRNLRSIAMSGLKGWNARLRDQLCLVHLAGARGTQDTADWVIPQTTDPDFADIVVNTIRAPTKNRQFYANDATSPATIGTNDSLVLQDIDRMISVLAESNVPMQACKYQDDKNSWDDPFYVLFVSERVWLYLIARTGQTQWRTVLQNAIARLTPEMRKHPIFSGDCGYWRNTFIKPLKRYAVRYQQNELITFDTGGADGFTYTESTSAVAATMTVDRSILVGAQALAMVYGQHKSSGWFADWNEEETDHKNSIEISTAMMGGCAKVRFRVTNKADGSKIDVDHGVAVIDSYAPDPQSAAGRTLLAT